MLYLFWILLFWVQTYKQKVSQKYQEQFVDELESPEQTRTQKGRIQKVEAGTDDLGGI